VPGTVGYSPEVVARLRAEPLDAELPGATALRTGEAVWIESREERDSRFPDMAQFEPTAVAMCAVPLTVGGRTLGALRFSFVEPRLFDDDQRRFVVALGAQVAQALDRAQLQAERIDVSRRLQRSLLPPHIPTIAGVDVAAVYHPFGAGLEVGGDFYDVWEIAAGRWGLAIGDATGTGPEAAAQTALVRHTIRAVAMFERRPGRVIEGLNDALLTAGNGGYAERFCTVIVGALSVVQGTVRVELASGGHPNPVLRTAEGRIGEIPMDGSLVGCFADITVSSTTVTLAPGDTLLLLTDGVLETRRGTEFFDVDGVRAVLEQPHDSAAAVARAVEDAVLEFGGGEPNDDVALLVLRCEG
jgi:serine phosphatase RsbU (regulator of sigma subunit)